MKELEKTNKTGKKGLELFINLFPFISLAVVVIGLMILTGGSLLQINNIKRIFEQSFAPLLVAGAVIFLMTQDCMDMSVGAIIGMSGAVAAYASQISIPLALVAALLTGLAIGIVNGFLNVTVQVPSSEELSGIGAAYAAGIAVGIYNKKEVLNKMTRTRFIPQMQSEERAQKYAGWKNAVEQVLHK